MANWYVVVLNGPKELTDTRMKVLFGEDQRTDPVPVGVDFWISDDRPEEDDKLADWLANTVRAALEDERSTAAGRLVVLEDLLDTLGDLRDELEGS